MPIFAAFVTTKRTNTQMHTKTKDKESKRYIQQEEQYGAHNYHPLPVVLSRGEGIYVWDVEGKKYVDFLSAYSAVNQGHANERLLQALSTQAQRLALTSRAFHNDQLGPYEQYICEYFGFEKVLPMNTGAEAVETALKIARKWGYEIKGVPTNKGIIVVCEQNFHGRTTTIISFSSDKNARDNFGPYTEGFVAVAYNDLEALAAALENPNVVGFLVEPIQGEAGVNVPDGDYISRAAALCRAKNVLFIADEIQTGIGRTGSLLAVCGDCSCAGHCERQAATYTRPDLLILGKALSGGLYPVSAVLADDKIMKVIRPGQHGSTYGGNPLACAIAREALEVLRDEKMTQNARKMGKLFRNTLRLSLQNNPLVRTIRGRGLLNAIIVHDDEDSQTAWNICLALADAGLLAKPTHGNIIRFAPPLIITEEQLLDCCRIITEVFEKVKSEK